MLNFVEFVLLIILIIVIGIFLFILTGIIYTKDNYVSIIEKNRKFYKLENRKFCYFFPIIFRKAFSYPLNEAVCNLKYKRIHYIVNDIMLLYENKIDINKLIKYSINIEDDFKKYNITLVKVEERE